MARARRIRIEEFPKAFTVEQLPALRRLYDQLVAKDLDGPIEKVIEAFGSSLHHAEFLRIVYTGHAFRKDRTELDVALADLERKFEALRGAVHKSKADSLRRVPAARPPKRRPTAARTRTVHEVPTTPAPAPEGGEPPAANEAPADPGSPAEGPAPAPSTGLPVAPTRQIASDPQSTGRPIVKGGVTLFTPAGTGVLRRVGPAAGQR